MCCTCLFWNTVHMMMYTYIKKLFHMLFNIMIPIVQGRSRNMTNDTRFLLGQMWFYHQPHRPIHIWPTNNIFFPSFTNIYFALHTTETTTNRSRTTPISFSHLPVSICGLSFSVPQISAFVSPCHSSFARRPDPLPTDHFLLLYLCPHRRMKLSIFSHPFSLLT